MLSLLLQTAPPETLPPFERAIDWVARGVEATGILIMVGGALLSSLVYLSRLLRRTHFDEIYRTYRTNLGRAILLGLEFLVAADIIGTVAVEPTFRSLGVLGAIVLIRTFLSFSLEVEINGRWPWQEGQRTREGGAEQL